MKDYEYTLRIGKITAELPEQIKMKVERAPWLHVAIAGMWHKDLKQYVEIDWAVYIWDTREVVDQGSLKLTKHPKSVYMASGAISRLSHAPASDNLEPLKGSKSKLIEYMFDMTRESGKNWGYSETKFGKYTQPINKK